MKKNTTISERILQIIDYVDVKPNEFAKKLNYKRSQAIYDIINGKSNPSFDFFSRLYNSEYSELFRYEWLIGGREPMLKESTDAFSKIGANHYLKEKESENMENQNYYFKNVMNRLKFSQEIEISDYGAPYYPLPVTAGNSAELLGEPENPTGFISVPGLTCKAFFPVIGCSFEPLIRAGDIIGIDFVNSWERLDPDGLYYIVTHDSRMLKSLMDHPKDPEKLICISPNLKEFTIWKSEIKVIHKVVFYARPI